MSHEQGYNVESASLYIPPHPFGFICDGVYRSSYPAHGTLAYIKSLNLKSMVALTPQDLKSELRIFCSNNDINIFECNIGFNQEPFVSMDEQLVRTATKYILDKSNHPVLLFCTNGKARTGVVVGCLRRHMGWSMVSIMHELEQFASDGFSNEAGLLDALFIQNYETE